MLAAESIDARELILENERAENSKIVGQTAFCFESYYSSFVDPCLDDSFSQDRKLPSQKMCRERLSADIASLASVCHLQIPIYDIDFDPLPLGESQQQAF